MPLRDNLPDWARGIAAQARAVDPFGRDDIFKLPHEKEGKRGEELFQLILSGIREIYEVDGVIAGGAVRDLAAGVTNHKDVDVWLPVSSDKFWFSCEELGWQGEFHGQPRKDYKGNTCIAPVLDRLGSRVQNVPVDVLLLEKPLSQQDVDGFPVYAQRCIWTLDGGLVLSPEAKKDIDNKTFTIDPTITDKERLKNVLEKVNGWKKREHYKDWTIVEPDIKEWWEVKDKAAKVQAKPPLIYGTREWAAAYIKGEVDAEGRWKV